MFKYDESRITLDCKEYDMETALNENNLVDYLKIIFPEENNWIHNKNFEGYRPDYRSEELKMIIEWDGPLHYTNPRAIIRDNVKKELYTKMGYKVVNIPYFIQLNHNTIYTYFKRDIQIGRKYPNGFITDNKNLKLPADFCTIGLLRYQHDLQIQDIYTRKEIEESLKVQCNYHHYLEVYPTKSLEDFKNNYGTVTEALVFTK